MKTNKNYSVNSQQITKKAAFIKIIFHKKQKIHIFLTKLRVFRQISHKIRSYGKNIFELVKILNSWSVN